MDPAELRNFAASAGALHGGALKELDGEHELVERDDRKVCDSLVTTLVDSEVVAADDAELLREVVDAVFGNDELIRVSSAPMLPTGN